MDAQFGSERNATNEEEQDVQCVGRKHEEWRYAECFIDCARDEVDEGKHAEDCNKHNVVDDGGAATDGFMNHVTDYRHYEEGPEELKDRSALSKYAVRQCATARART